MTLLNYVSVQTRWGYIFCAAVCFHLYCLQCRRWNTLSHYICYICCLYGAAPWQEVETLTSLGVYGMVYVHLLHNVSCKHRSVHRWHNVLCFFFLHLFHLILLVCMFSPWSSMISRAIFFWFLFLVGGALSPCCIEKESIFPWQF